MKRIVVIADIHAHYPALESAYDFVKEIDPEAVIFLGDYVTDCPYPQKTIEFLHKFQAEYQTFFVRGNREDYLLEHYENPDDDWSYSSSTGALLYTYDNLTEKDFDFFKKMPVCLDISVPGCPIITACHGSPESTKESIRENDYAIKKYAKKISGEILLCGHSHKSKVCRIGNKQVVFCPSLGQPQNEKNNERITLLECVGGKWHVTMHSLTIDNEKLFSDFKKSGLSDIAPVWSKCIIKSIKTGRDCAYECVNLAWKLAYNDNFTGSVLPEKYFVQAARELEFL